MSLTTSQEKQENKTKENRKQVHMPTGNTQVEKFFYISENDR